MQNETQPSCGAVMHEFDPALLELELASFQALLDQPMTETLINYWIADFRIQKVSGLSGYLSNTVWGTIRWPKSIGRPLTPMLASAFVIEHIHWDSKMDVTGGVARVIDILAPHPEPSKWDGPDDEDYYRVSFMTDTPQRPTRIRVNFAAHIRWEQIQGAHITGRGYRDIAPPERHFHKGDKISILEPFEIVIKPFSRLLKT